jgi:hypothetical protein
MSKIRIQYEDRGSHSAEYYVCGIVECDYIWFGKWVPFQRNLLSPSTGQKTVRLKHQVHLNGWYLLIRLHCITSQKTVISVWIQ